MSQVYARQAEAQAASLEAQSGGDQRQKSPGEDSSDSESYPKPRDAYMQEGLERPRDGPPEDEDEEEDSEEDGEDMPCEFYNITT